jgi:hypothetical protein
MTADVPNKNPAIASAERCPKCSLGLLQRASARGQKENMLFLLGAGIIRCSSCEIRQAVWKGFRMPLSTDETDNAYLLTFASVGGGLLFCLAIALLMLRRAHRWPF